MLNANNISGQGTITGLTTVQGPPVGALTTASNATAATQQAAAPAQSNNDRPSIIIVEVLGYGGGSGNDATPDSEEEKRHKAKDRQSYDPAGSVQYVGVGALTDDQKRTLTLPEQSRLVPE